MSIQLQQDFAVARDRSLGAHSSHPSTPAQCEIARGHSRAYRLVEQMLILTATTMDERQ